MEKAAMSNVADPQCIMRVDHESEQLLCHHQQLFHKVPNNLQFEKFFDDEQYKHIAKDEEMKTRRYQLTILHQFRRRPVHLHNLQE